MNKKIYLSILAVLIVVLLFLRFFIYKHQDQSNNLSTKEKFSDTMVGGKIIESKDNSIVIKGTVKASNQADFSLDETKTIEFIFTPETVIIKSELTRPVDVEEGKQFKPVVKEMSGDKTGLTLNKVVTNLHSVENLFKVDKATLVDIKYDEFKFRQ